MKNTDGMKIAEPQKVRTSAAMNTTSPDCATAKAAHWQTLAMPLFARILKQEPCTST